MTLLQHPAMIQQFLLQTQVTMIWRNENGQFVGPYVESYPSRHAFAPVAVATKKQLQRGRRS